MTKRSEAFEIQGIQRNVNPTNAPLGSCNDIQNLRYIDGGWRPVRKKKSVKHFIMPPAVLETRAIYAHDALPEDEFIAHVMMNTRTHRVIHIKIKESTKFYDASEVVTTLRVFSDIREVVWNIVPMDNILIITTNLNTTFHFYVDGKYKINKGVDAIPEPRYGFVEGERRYSIITHSENKDSFAAAASKYLEERFNAAKENFIEGEVFLTTAWKLKDGTYIKHDNPSYISAPHIHRTGFDAMMEGQKRSPLISTRVFGTLTWQVRNMQFSKVQFITDAINVGEWENVIDSLCVFAMPPFQFPISTNKEDYEENDYDHQNNSLTAYLPKRGDVEDHFKNSLFYKVAEFSPDDLKKAIEEDLDFTHLETKESLPPDQLSHHTLMGRKALTYNSMLHFGDIKTRVYKGHNLLVRKGDHNTIHVARPESTAPRQFVNSQVPVKTRTVLSTTKGKVGAEADLPVEDYKSAIQYSDTSGTFMVAKTQYLFSPVISYPHPNGKSITISRGGQIKFIKNLSSHFHYSFSFFLNKEGDWAQYIVDDVPDIPSKWESLPNTYEDKNRLQLSSVSNPFLYPAMNSYRMGSDEKNVVIDMSVQSTPTSEGQFGEFPLVIFTVGGVYLLDQGAGQVMYQSMRNISRVTANENALAIDGAVVFTTRDGIFAVQGREVVEISRELIKQNPFNIYDDDIGEKPIAFTDNFNDFLQNAIFGFDDQYLEVIVANPKYDFTIRFAARAPRYFRVSGRYDGMMISRGRYLSYLVEGAVCRIMDLGKDETESGNTHVYFITNPYIHGGQNLKKVIQARLTGYAIIPEWAEGVVFRVLGSNLVNLKEGEPVVVSTEFSLLQKYQNQKEWASYPDFFTADTTEFSADNDEITVDTIVLNIDTSGSEPSHESNMLTSRAGQSSHFIAYSFSGVINNDSVFERIELLLEDRLLRKMR